MILRRSAFCHLVALSADGVLVTHAFSQTRLTVTPEIARLVEWFDRPQDDVAAVPLLAKALGHDDAAIQACIASLLERGMLTSLDAEAEHAALSQSLAATHGRDPSAMLDRYRRARVEGPNPYWAVATPQGLGMPLRHRVDALLFGDCDVQMETDFLRREAARRGVDLRITTAFANDLELAGERRHDVIVVGALQARHAVALGDVHHHGGDVTQVYAEAARGLLARLRAITTAPILLDGLPEPSLQPLGFADRGLDSHRNRFRRTNLALTALADSFTDVFLIDIAAALGAAGVARLLDDGLVSFTHFGSPGWLLQRPPSERAAVHDQFPDMQPLTDALAGDAYEREAVTAAAHMDAIATVLALGRKKCVIVDLDGVLWPGVLAETGAPFAWSPEISSQNSYVGLYFGLHEALLALRQRGILLACVSKNDATTVERLWQYPEHYPHHRLLTAQSFVTTRINWSDKAENIRSIAEELGFALDAFIFVDDTPRERERVRESLPEVTVLGENLFTLRHALLTDPGLQAVRLTAEAANRHNLVKAQLDRTRLRSEMPSEAAFLSSLAAVSTVERLGPAANHAAELDRISELFARTTQFNATGERFTAEVLHELLDSKRAAVFTLRMRDRFADHGLVGAAIVAGRDILNVVLSCRVIGLGGERALLAAVAANASAGGQALRGRIVPTDRNAPVRHLYRDAGYTTDGAGTWFFPPGGVQHAAA